MMSYVYRFNVLLLLVIFLTGFSACGAGNSEQHDDKAKSGSIVFEIETPTMAATKATKAINLTMTYAYINLYHPDSGASESFELAIEDNKATGRLDDLQVGTWEITVDVNTAEGYMFWGQDQVTVQADVAVGANLLLDLEDGDYSVGSIIFNIGFNPLPGYKTMRGTSSDTALATDSGVVMFNETGQMVLYDSMLENPVTYDMPYTEAPVVSCLGYTEESAYVGYVISDDGYYREIEIYEIDLLTGTYNVIMTSYNVVAMQNIEADVLMLGHIDPGFDDEIQVEIINYYAGASGMNSYAPGTEIVYNPTTKKIYHAAHDPIGMDLLESGDLYYDDYNGYYYFYVDQTVDYSGVYVFDGPMALMAPKNRLIMSSGDMFYSSLDEAVDMTYAGNIGMTFVDFAYLSGDEYMFLVTDAEDKELVVLDDINYLPVTSVSLDGEFQKLVVTDQFVYVFTTYEEVTFAKVWDKSYLIDHL